MTETSYQRHAPRADDPVVCQLCGGTLGRRGYLDSLTAAQRTGLDAAHEQECQKRREHQRRHATIPGPCPDCKIDRRVET